MVVKAVKIDFAQELLQWEIRDLSIKLGSVLYWGLLCKKKKWEFIAKLCVGKGAQWMENN